MPSKRLSKTVVSVSYTHLDVYKRQELVQPGGESVVVKIFEAEKIGEAHQLVPGTLQTDGKTYIRVAAEDRCV